MQFVFYLTNKATNYRPSKFHLKGNFNFRQKMMKVIWKMDKTFWIHNKTVQNVVFSYTNVYEKMRDLGWVFLLYINRAGKITPLNSILENCWWNVLLHGPNFLLPTICKKIIIIIPNQHNTRPLNLSLFTCICIKINDTLLQWFGCFKKLIFAFPQ